MNKLYSIYSTVLSYILDKFYAIKSSISDCINNIKTKVKNLFKKAE